MSGKFIKLKPGEAQITISSANLDKCTMIIEALDKDSRTKSLSLTASIEFSIGFLKPNALAVSNLSIGNDVPAKAADPKGDLFNLSLAS